MGLSAPVNFTVLPANSPPVIAAPPQGQNVQLGTSLLLAPIVVGPLPLQYQWQLNGQNLSGQTNAHLSLTNVQAPQAGNYRLVVTNQYGLATSAVARLTLFATNLLFTSATTTVDGRLHLGVSAGVGTAFSVQTSTNLQSWTTLQQLTGMTQTTNLIYTLEPQTAARYFRLSSP